MNKKPTKKKFRLSREAKMDIVLKPLAGNQRKAMLAILQTVPTSLLSRTYELFIDKVLQGKK